MTNSIKNPVVLVIILLFFMGCENKNPADIPVNLSTPEGVVRTYWKYIDSGEYDKAYNLYCDDKYFDETHKAREYNTILIREPKERVRNSIKRIYDKIDVISLEVDDAVPITSKKTQDLYGVGKVVEEGYLVLCYPEYDNKDSIILGDRGFYVVKYGGRYCIAR